jgi:hypothetical protein
MGSRPIPPDVRFSFTNESASPAQPQLKQPQPFQTHHESCSKTSELMG